MDFSDLTIEQINERIAAALDAFKALNIATDSTEEALTEGETLAAEVTALRAELSQRAEAAQKAQARVDEMSAILTEAAVEEPEVIEATPEVTVEAAVEVEEEDGDEEEDDAEVEEDDAEEDLAVEPAPVAASAQTSPAKRAAARAPEVKMPKSSAATVVLTAAADVPGFVTGSQLTDLTDVAKAITNRVKSFPSSGPEGVYSRYGGAMINRSGNEFSQDNPDFRDDQSLIDAAAREHRLSGGSLVAAGGWCAPSETMYDMCQYESTDGLLDIPEVTVTRGGMRYTSGPDFSAIYSGSGFWLTEAQVIAGTSKTCYEVPCPTFTDVRLDAVGMCVKAGILTESAYPELVRRVIEGVLVAHQQKVSAGLIAAIGTALGTALTPVDQGSTASTLDSLQWVAESLRQKYRLSDSATMEVLLPHWMPISLKEDIGRRTGRAAPDVTDAEVSAYFSTRNLAPQYVYGLSDLNLATNLQVKPPATTTALIYPAGTFVKGVSPVINLDAVYDTASLQTNTYTALFMEEGVLLAQRCFQGAKVTIPVCDSGRTGAADLDKCMGTVES